jgi:hypothetical protein
MVRGKATAVARIRGGRKAGNMVAKKYGHERGIEGYVIQLSCKRSYIVELYVEI